MWPNELLSARRLNDRAALLDGTVVRRAFALVSLSHPHLSFADWSRYLTRAARLDPRKAGLVSIEDPRGYARALFRYVVDRDPPLASADNVSVHALRLRDLVLADLPGQSLLSAIAEEGETLARSLNCNSVMIELPTTVQLSSRYIIGFIQVNCGIMKRHADDIKVGVRNF